MRKKALVSPNGEALMKPQFSGFGFRVNPKP